MTPEERARRFKALGDPTRLKIFQYICSCSSEVSVCESGDVRPVSGTTVGEVCCQITSGGGNSLVSFHLKELRQVGLITMERRGKFMVCKVNAESVQELAEFLGGWCCAEDKETI